MVKILVFNVGSSTIKYSLFEDEKQIINEKYEKLNNKRDYEKAFYKIKDSLDKFDIIAHRIVHGGNISKTSLINNYIKKQIKTYSTFAPLHNPNELLIINLCEREFPDKNQYAVFDTSFFVNLPEITKTYPIPKELTKKYSIRRYGFHGLSHKSVSRDLNGKTITGHLGRGVSLTAINNGKAIDTSMGLTPMEGLMMGTRSGTIDPGLIIFLQKNNYDVNKILNFNSGFKGLCSYSDFRDILKNMKKKEVKLTYDIFIYQIIKHIGAYSAVLGGLDNLVFTGAIGENSYKLREDVCKYINFLGVKIDNIKNKKNQEIISSANSKVNIYVRKADEEKIIAEEVLKII